MGTKMGPAGAGGDDGHQDGSRRTKQRLRVPRWVGQDQEQMMGAKMSPAGPGRDDWCQDGSFKARSR